MQSSRPRSVFTRLGPRFTVTVGPGRPTIPRGASAHMGAASGKWPEAAFGRNESRIRGVYTSLVVSIGSIPCAYRGNLRD